MIGKTIGDNRVHNIFRQTLIVMYMIYPLNMVMFHSFFGLLEGLPSQNGGVTPNNEGFRSPKF